MVIKDILGFLSSKPKFRAFLIESGCDLLKIKEIKETEEVSVTHNFVRKTRGSGFFTYEVTGDDFYIKIKTHKDDRFFYLESLYVKDGMF